MRSYSILILFILLGSLAFSQERKTGTVDHILFSPPFNNIPVMGYDDTLSSPFLNYACADTPVVFHADAGGYINGNNAYNDKEKIQMIKLPASGTGYCTDVLVTFATINVTGDAVLKAKVYNADAEGKPFELIGESAGLPVSYCDTSGLFTVFTIPDAIVFENTLFAGIDFSELYDSGDSACIVSTNNGCGDSLQVWEKWEDETWHPYCCGPSTWNLNIALWVYAVVDWSESSTGLTDQYSSKNELTIFPSYPSPAKNYITIPFSVDEASDIKIEIYSYDGKMIDWLNLDHTAVGHHIKLFALDNYSAGQYFYSISTKTTKLFSKFIIAD